MRGIVGELLEKIKQPNDIHKMKPEELRPLAKEIRRFLVQSISHTGGHLSSNLGVVELTMALHLCCDLPQDKIVWDVGHQSYTHKLLTGRREGFRDLRRFEGMSGFPKRSESDCDAFDTGHSSTSISAALGFAKARDLLGQDYKIFAVIGDGALSGGMAYEALNNATQLKSNLVIVLNDNQMSISHNVGGMSSYLGKIRTSGNYTGLKEEVEKILSRMPGLGDKLTDKIRDIKDLVKRMFIPGMLFEDMGLTYIGPIDGHDISQMTAAFRSASQMKSAVIVHVCTKKGKGYLPAEADPSRFHGVAPFYPKDGKERGAEKEIVSYTDVFRDAVLAQAERQKDFVAVSAAMPSGTGLHALAEAYPGHFIDVGIAEEHAVTFAAGMAAGGLKPVVAVYSTFLQRAYDQILHDVCIGNLPVVFAVDRAGLVGSDGETHQGIFDLAYLRSMPNMTVMAPKNAWELDAMLQYAWKQETPVAVRYPRGEAWQGLDGYCQEIETGRAEWICSGEEIALVAVGSMVQTAMEVREILKIHGKKVSVINARFVKPLDETLLESLPEKHSLVVTLEEGVCSGGFGEAVAAWYSGRKVTVLPVALPDKFIEHGSVAELKKKYGLDKDSIAKKILAVCERE
jgi:1-deoxy-D-xylulose-5-phosphate synthase